MNSRNNNIQSKMKPTIKFIATLVFPIQKHFPTLLGKAKTYHMVQQKEFFYDFTSMSRAVALLQSKVSQMSS